MNNSVLKKINNFCWELPRSFQQGMRVPGRIYATEKMLEHIIRDDAFKQVANVATLPGIIKYSMAMPDIHWGYGFPIGGVAAMDAENGVVSPGGVGYDINCGVRLVRTNLMYNEVAPKLKQLVDLIFKKVPCGVGSRGKITLSSGEMDAVLKDGSRWAMSNGFGWTEDLEATEEGGRMAFADPSKVSPRARKRGQDQLGTLGSGNHFLEIQKVTQIFDEKIAEQWGIFKNQIVVMIHCGSRGLGHQVCDEFEHILVPMLKSFGFDLPDRQLACAPVKSKIGQDYLGAMAAAANFAWANRQIIMHWVREAFSEIFKKSPQKLGMNLIYDVAHNIAKFETHDVDGVRKKLLVHRKGATRAFAAGRMELSQKYRSTGQPVIIPGDMGRASYVLVGTESAMKETFGSTCHGAGRYLSRRAAIKKIRGQGRSIRDELAEKGIYIRWVGRNTLFEEAPEAYKDISDVVEAVEGAGISRKVARMIPVGVVKG
ncbi:RtcB family protein [bacterium]|nr:RtcB family protein [bacterium]